MSSSANPVEPGEPVTFTATVTPSTSGNFTAGGTVSFTFDGNALGGPVPLVDGMATSAATLPAQMTAGTHAVIATYSGDGVFLTSNTTISQVVPVVTISDPVLLEGNSGTSDMLFVVTRLDDTAQPLEVDFATQDAPGPTAPWRASTTWPPAAPCTSPPTR